MKGKNEMNEKLEKLLDRIEYKKTSYRGYVYTSLFVVFTLVFVLSVMISIQ